MTSADAASMFERVMGAEFYRLHPQLQRRFSVGLGSGVAGIGTGVMEEVWHTAGWVRPFLLLGATRNILAPRRGKNVPFQIENVPYTDSFGRETVSFVRTFGYPRGTKRFDAQMVIAPEQTHIIDYLGTHQHLETPLYFSAEEDGSLTIRSQGLRFREGPVDVTVPGFISADATIREQFEEQTGRLRISVTVANDRIGPLFGYRGWFEQEYFEVAKLKVRPGLRPKREHNPTDRW
ncbi:DUF4166 domain-containing protein [Nesterenkonia ebinurensis]|uniref:DUF4166 domain-containing protein n=1 Tax=Nesterenkonia ebinurensis TaxID=2608252 RepID=UPI00123E142D|nr:DUF4166 domain-containing protein [Nesterenkonia ebinurensis]